jgi:hypothetical protein
MYIKYNFIRAYHRDNRMRVYDAILLLNSSSFSKTKRKCNHDGLLYCIHSTSHCFSQGMSSSKRVSLFIFVVLFSSSSVPIIPPQFHPPMTSDTSFTRVVFVFILIYRRRQFIFTTQ